MSRKRYSERLQSNRILFYAILGLAVLLILCSLVTQAVGWPRFCGGGLILTGAFFLLLAENKRWPALILLIGLLLFFVDLQAIFSRIGQ
jgi:membrane-bound ClpP family serine protease